MRVLVLYESHRGFTLTVARAIRDELEARGVSASTAPLRTVDVGTLTASDALIVGTWVKGAIVVGVGPAVGVREAVAALPPLEGRPAAVFCTCDVAPRGTLRTLAAWLERQGAAPLVGRSFRRKKSLRDVPAFAERALEAFVSFEPTAAEV
jgi:flavodoxin